MQLKSKLIALALSTVLGVLSAPVITLASAADSTAGARTSEYLSVASGMVVSGSLGVLAEGGELIVVSAEQSARGVAVVVGNVTEASGEVVTVLMDSATASSIAVGQALQTTATGVGYVLLVSGRAIAFIPNEIGQSLLHQSRYSR